MKTINTCCGSFVRRTVKTITVPLPPNPKVRGGISVIYLGAGDVSIKGLVTGSVYYASDHSRHFRVYSDDMDSVLRPPYVIRKP